MIWNHFASRSAVVCCSLMLAAGSSWAQTANPREPAQEAREAARQTGNAITDSWITMKIHSQFIPEDALEGSDIDVTTRNGVVSLTGTVRTQAGKERAVAIAKATDGVKSVNDKLRVSAATGEAEATTGTAGRTITDGWIKSKIYSQFLTEDALEDSDVNIEVRKGAVSLNGTVKSEAGRERAAAIAKTTEGVKSVKNNLKVNPKAR